MLDRMHALQRSPIPEPNHSLLTTHAAEFPLHEVFQLGAGLGEEVVGYGVGGRGEFGPDDEVHDARVDAVGPVVEEDFVGVFLEGRRQYKVYTSSGLLDKTPC